MRATPYSLSRLLKSSLSGAALLLPFFCPPLFAEIDNSDPLVANQHLSLKSYSNPVIAIMSNNDLLESATQSRLSPSNTTQQKLNQRWLQIHTGEEDVVQGGKALSKFLQRGLKEYWNGQREQYFHDNKKVPDIYGRGQFNNSLEYKLRLKSDELRVGLQYEF